MSEDSNTQRRGTLKRIEDFDGNALKKYAARLEKNVGAVHEELNALRNSWKKLRYPQKDIILNSLAILWETLADGEKSGLWKKLSDAQKAELLEVFSRKYTMAHAVFAAREFVKETLRRQGFSEVHIQLAEPLAESDKIFGKKYGNKIKGAVPIAVMNTDKGKVLSMMICYWCPAKDMTSYENKYISEESRRFVVSHEIAHIILHINDIIRGESILWVCDDGGKTKEYEADCFAKILSDLRDRHILECHGSDRDRKEAFNKQYAIARSYEKEMRGRKVDFENIISSVIKLDKLSEGFTMSNSIFATRKIISIYDLQNIPSNEGDKDDLGRIRKEKEALWQKQQKIRIYPDKRANVGEVSIIRVLESEMEYKIALPERGERDIRQDSKDIAKALAAFSLRYEKIKDRSDAILVNKEFRRDFEEFSEALLKARKSNIETVLAKIRSSKGSGERILSA